MEDIVQFIGSLGDLHDATVLELLWQPGNNSLEIEIEDIFWNFEGLPEYGGPVKGRFLFSQVTRFDADVNFLEAGLMIYEWTFDRANTSGHLCEIRFWPSGRMVIQCTSIECTKTPG